MKLSAKGRYAIQAMINIALNNTKEPITLVSLARRQKISLSYLEQLFSLLRKKNLVSGVRGPGGGYKLINKPENITIAQILSAIYERDNKLADNQQKDHLVWNVFSDKMNEYLNTVTLGSLIQDTLETKVVVNENTLIDEKSNITETPIVTEKSLLNSAKGI